MSKLDIVSLHFRLPIILLIVLFVLVGCSNNKDRGDGFKLTQTTKSVDTKLSNTPVLEQPCSLVTKDEAAMILSISVTSLAQPESSKPRQGVLRCRYSAISDDKKLFLVLNIYVYTKQSEFDLVRKSHKATEIQTTVDEGFYYDITTNRQSERFVGARSGDIRIGVSSSIALTDGNETLKKDQITLPKSSTLAELVGNIIAKQQ